MPITLGDAVLLLSANNRQLNRDLDTAERGTTRWAGRVGDVIGTRIEAGILQAVSLVQDALMALPQAAWEMATGMDRATNMIQARLGLTADEAERMGNVVRNVFGEGYGDGIEDITGTLNTAVAAFGDSIGQMDDSTLQSIIMQATDLRDVFGVDVQESIRAAATMMNNGLAPSAQAAFDIITAGMQNGVNVSGDLIDTLTEYSDDFADLGLSGNEVLTILNNGISAGAFNTDKLADAMNEFGVNLRDPALGESIAAIDSGALAIYQQFQAGEITERQALFGMMERLRAIQDPMAQDQLGVQLFRSMWEDLGATAMLEMTNMQGGLIQTGGATAGLGVIHDDVGSRMETMWNRIQLALEPAGAAFLGFLEDILPDLEAFVTNTLVPAIGQLANWLRVNLPVALATARRWFETNLLPALQSIWSFVTEQLIPAFESVVSFFDRISGGLDSWNHMDEGLNAVSNAITENNSSLGDVIGATWGAIRAEFGFADGGPVSGGQPIIVGEEGPEIFRPNSDGMIIPNGALGGGGGSNTFNFYGTAAPSSPEEARQAMDLITNEMRARGMA